MVNDVLHVNDILVNFDNPEAVIGQMDVELRLLMALGRACVVSRWWKVRREADTDSQFIHSERKLSLIIHRNPLLMSITLHSLSALFFLCTHSFFRVVCYCSSWGGAGVTSLRRIFFSLVDENWCEICSVNESMGEFVIRRRVCEWTCFRRH